MTPRGILCSTDATTLLHTICDTKRSWSQFTRKCWILSLALHQLQFISFFSRCQKCFLYLRPGEWEPCWKMLTEKCLDELKKQLWIQIHLAKAILPKLTKIIIMILPLIYEKLFFKSLCTIKFHKSVSVFFRQIKQSRIYFPVFIWYIWYSTLKWGWKPLCLSTWDKSRTLFVACFLGHDHLQSR